MNAAFKSNVDQLVAEHSRGYSLQQDFYESESVFQFDMQRVVSEQWLLVDHESRIPNLGDYFLFSVGNEEIVIIRSSEDTIHAMFNVCRHRGSRICLEKQGRKRILTCPYHAWSYDLDGSLRAARLMPDGFDRNEFGLNQCHVRVFHGLIFVCLSTSEPPDFESMYSEFDQTLDFHGFSDAKIAAKIDYPNTANWKLVVENFIECYHCAPAHPEYCNVHPADQLLALGAGPGSGPKDAMEKYQSTLTEWKTMARELGHPSTSIERDDTSVDMAQLARFPINSRGFESETRDGKAACNRRMGNFERPDFGETAFSFNPFSYILAFNDFAVLIRFTPISALKSDIQLSWLVHENSEEGVDYDVDNLTWVWNTTIKQDKSITENNQLGVSSSRYQPGPYSTQEGRVVTFVEWYLNKLQKC